MILFVRLNLTHIQSLPPTPNKKVFGFRKSHGCLFWNKPTRDPATVHSSGSENYAFSTGPWIHHFDHSCQAFMCHKLLSRNFCRGVDSIIFRMLMWCCSYWRSYSNIVTTAAIDKFPFSAQWFHQSSALTHVGTSLRSRVWPCNSYHDARQSSLILLGL